MDNILKSLMAQFGDNELGLVSEKTGVEKSKAASALEGVMPTLLGAMAGNASTKSGASSLIGALDRDHDGSILDDVAGFLQNTNEGPGNGILKHVLGSKRQDVESQISQKTGLDSGSIGKILAMAAPIVMGYLSREKKKQGVDESGLGGLLQGMANNASDESSFDLSDVIGMVAGGTKGNSGLGGFANVLGGILGKN